MSLEQLKCEVALANRILSITGLSAGVRAAMGHVSCRDPADSGRFVVKGRGYAIDVLSRMLPQNMVVCDLEGYLLEGPPGTAQCNEVKIHSSIYKARPDVRSVVHVHPPYSVMLTLRGIAIRPVVLEGLRLVRKPLPVYPHTALITNEEQGSAMARMLGDGPAIHLLGHGAVTVGGSIEEAVTRMLHLEHQARMNFQAHSLPGDGPLAIPDELIEEFLRWQPHAELHFQEALARTGPVPHLGGMWADLVARAQADLDGCTPSLSTNERPE